MLKKIELVIPSTEVYLCNYKRLLAKSKNIMVFETNINANRRFKNNIQRN